ncbi:hypothetical protein HPB50_015870 [Hyalomma asiaticum]|uniref:Uncharacterized protein n=1 Tax=Hyalomma asiaticum TaxID=266040 RepID=A0ACB7RUZ6_HYAAI|nr:hypothetical protein HPB50_015870 [Hyalomma asiaticum]
MRHSVAIFVFSIIAIITTEVPEKDSYKMADVQAFPPDGLDDVFQGQRYRSTDGPARPTTGRPPDVGKGAAYPRSGGQSDTFEVVQQWVYTYPRYTSEVLVQSWTDKA